MPGREFLISLSLLQEHMSWIVKNTHRNLWVAIQKKFFFDIGRGNASTYIPSSLLAMVSRIS